MIKPRFIRHNGEWIVSDRIEVLPTGARLYTNLGHGKTIQEAWFDFLFQTQQKWFRRYIG